MRRAFLAGTAFFLLLVIAAASAASFDRAVSLPDVLKVKRVAVLPFNNISGRRDAGEMVANMFTVEVFKLGRFQVEEPGNIMQFMIQERINTIGEIDLESMKRIAERFGVDAVILGTVEEYDDGRSSVPPQPVVSISARMVEPSTGKIIWSSQNRRTGKDYVIAFDYGRARSGAALTKIVVNEMVQTMQEKH